MASYVVDRRLLRLERRTGLTLSFLYDVDVSGGLQTENPGTAPAAPSDVRTRSGGRGGGARDSLARQGFGVRHPRLVVYRILYTTQDNTPHPDGTNMLVSKRGTLCLPIA